VVAVTLDITERKRAQETMRQIREQLGNQALHLEALVKQRTAELLAANKQLETFVYSIAHDLRAPLRSMQGFSALLIEEAGAALSGEAKDYAHRISKSAQFMDALLVDLLAFSRISQEDLEIGTVNLETIVKAALAPLEKEIQERAARVEVAGAWPAVVAHAASLRQVMVNLVSNGLKFVPPGTKPVVSLWAEEFSIPRAPAPPGGPQPAQEHPEGNVDWVRVWVEDNGIGIAPEHQEQIFRLFTRLRGDAYVGTGIGLAIVQIGIERMGGRVGLESAPGKGSRFWFELRKG
jgi:signal transduction histidine kinase